MLLFYRKLFLVLLTSLTFFQATICVAQNQQAAPPTCPSTGSEQTIVEDIIFLGSPNTNVGVLQTFFEIPTGQCLSRYELDRKILEGRTRLEALGEYQNIEIELKKGTNRGHYLLAITLTGYTPIYGGANFAIVRENKSTSSHDGFISGNYDPADQKEWKAGAFLGTRNLFQSQARLDLESRYSSRNNNYESFGTESKTTYSTRVTSLNLYHPNLFNKNFVGGFNVIYYSLHEDYDYTSDDTGYADSGSWTSQNYFVSAKFGYRWRLLTVAPTLYRTFNKFEGYGEVERNSLTYSGVQASYSTKTGLAAVEPGVFIKTHWSRETAPVFGSIVWESDAEYTTFALSWLAITPELGSVWWNYEDDDDGFDRSYIYSLRTEMIFYRNFIVLLRASGTERKPSDNKEPSTYSRSYELTTSYLNQGFRFDLSFMLGKADYSSFGDFDKRRVAE